MASLDRFLRPSLSRRLLVTRAALAGGSAALAPAGLRAVLAQDAPGSDLVGELQGPTLVLEEGQAPSQYNEAPQLAEQVAAGSLPPVDERLGQDPLVIDPVTEIGQYGGTWRRGFTGPGDGENGNRLNSSDKPLFWEYTGENIAPSLARDWEVGDEGRTLTLYLRRGMHWSDGEPFTADAFMFWYEDMYQNEELIPVGTPEFSINGQPGTVVKIDESTIQYQFPEPYPLFEEILAGSTAMGAGLSTRGDNLMGAYAPGHYLKQFHPKYVDQAELDQIVADEGYDNWVNLFKFKNTWRLNPDMPVVSPWRTTTPINNPTWVMERNPYYWAVDTEGNQLPYIDQIVMTLAENLEVAALRAIAGEYDWQARHMEINKLPVFIENQESGDYKVHLDPGFYGSDAAFHLNQSYDADPEIAKWMKNLDFRHALALGIDRDQLNETFWVGIGTPGSPIPAPDTPQYPGDEYRTLWSTFDPDQANELLDGLGLTEKDGEGFRLRSDNGERLRFEVTTVGGAFINWTQIAEVVSQQWAQIGIQAVVVENERSLALQRNLANETQIFVWVNDGTENIYLFPRHALPVDDAQAFMGPLYATWYASGGEQGVEPDDPEMIKVMDLFRSAAGFETERRNEIAQEIWRILVEQQYTIGTVGLSPAVMGIRLVKNNVGNVPARLANGQHLRTPATSQPPTYFFTSPSR